MHIPCRPALSTLALPLTATACTQSLTSGNEKGAGGEGNAEAGGEEKVEKYDVGEDSEGGKMEKRGSQNQKVCKGDENTIREGGWEQKKKSKNEQWMIKRGWREEEKRREEKRR